MKILSIRKFIPIAVAAGGVLLWKHFNGKHSVSNRQVVVDKVLSRHWLKIDGLKYHALVSSRHSNSSKPPVVLVHGLGVSSSYFVSFAEKLAFEFEVYVPDLPGHGKSDTPRRPMDIKALAQALAKWMQIAGIPRATLIGQSMGCQIAVELALTHPEKVERLVLIGLTADPHARSAFIYFIRLVKTAVHERLSIAWPVAKDYLRMNRRIFSELTSMLEDPIREKLKRLSAPCMLVRGEHDAIFPYSWFEEAIALSGAQNSAVIKDGAHTVQYSMPEKLVSAIHPFISRREKNMNRHDSREEKHPSAIKVHAENYLSGNELRQI